jgi:uncharacterized protein (TIGR02466 family)
MFLPSSVLYLFATPVYVNVMQTLTDDKKEFIKSLEFESLYSGKGQYTINQQLLNLPELKEVKEEVDYHVENYARDIIKVHTDQQFYLTNSWALRQNKGDWAHAHHHTNSVFSGVFYLYQDEDFGNLTFEKSSDNIFTKTLDPYYTEFTPMNSGTWSIQPVANMIVMFPSILKHGVEMSRSEKTRYSVAFNYFMKGQFGHKESELHL